MVKKVFPFVMILLAVAGIMYLTVMKLDDTVMLSESFRGILIAVGNIIGVDTSSEWWNSGSTVRLLGHVIEYFALGLIVGFAVKKKILGFIICLVISFADQIVKIYIPARHFDIGDIPFDIIGFCCGLAIAWVIKITVCKLKEDSCE